MKPIKLEWKKCEDNRWECQIWGYYIGCDDYGYGGGSDYDNLIFVDVDYKETFEECVDEFQKEFEKQLIEIKNKYFTE